MVCESNLLEKDLEPIAVGHKMNGVPLVTPSLYCDMALTLGEYLRKKDAKLADSLVDVQHMDVQRPLVTKVKSKDPQPLRCRVEFDTSTGKAGVEFWSFTLGGKKLTIHAVASISFPNKNDALAETSKNALAILARMAELRRELFESDRVQKFKRNAGYKLVASLASYANE